MFGILLGVKRSIALGLSVLLYCMEYGSFIADCRSRLFSVCWCHIPYVWNYVSFSSDPLIWLAKRHIEHWYRKRTAPGYFTVLCHFATVTIEMILQQSYRCSQCTCHSGCTLVTSSVMFSPCHSFVYTWSNGKTWICGIRRTHVVLLYTVFVLILHS